MSTAKPADKETDDGIFPTKSLADCEPSLDAIEKKLFNEGIGSIKTPTLNRQTVFDLLRSGLLNG